LEVATRKGDFRFKKRGEEEYLKTTKTGVFGGS
jgi:hypothetical protein